MPQIRRTPKSQRSNSLAMHRFQTLISCLCVMMLGAPAALALTAGSTDPIRIEANQASLDDSKGIATYVGRVVVTQGPSKLEADRVVIFTENNQLVRIEAHGNPAHFTQLDTAKAQQTDAYGDQIIYEQREELLKLLHNAKLQQGKNSFQGDMIEYDTINRIVNAKGSEAGDGTNTRVELIIHPQSREAPADRKPAEPADSEDSAQN